MSDVSNNNIDVNCENSLENSIGNLQIKMFTIFNTTMNTLIQSNTLNILLIILYFYYPSILLQVHR